MSFSFSAAGTRQQTIESLNKAQMYGDGLGEKIRDAIVVSLESAADKTGDTDLRYEVSASGHSGPGSATSLNVRVTAAAAPPQVQGGF